MLYSLQVKARLSFLWQNAGKLSMVGACTNVQQEMLSPSEEPTTAERLFFFIYSSDLNAVIA